MASEETPNNIFSQKTFRLLGEWSQKYDHQEKIEESFRDDFQQYAEKPFQLFCEKVANALPPHFSVYCIEKDKTFKPYMEKPDSCIKTYFSTSKLIFIEITIWGINTGINNEVYQGIIKKISQNNLQELTKFISINSNFFVHENPLFISPGKLKDETGYERAVLDVALWLKKYLIWIILAVHDEPIQVINNLSNLNSYILNRYISNWDETGFTEKELQCWLRAINRKGQAIIYGSPGTGKTFIAQRLAEKIVGKYGFIELVQFHPAYTYEDFIQGIRPQSEDGKLTYTLVPGRFLEFCKKAEICQDTCVLIIDEINRANLPQVFGELMYLLEYRDQEIPLAGGNRFRIPKNVRIIGTMNTADRSIAQIDHALRRRFAFIELCPNYDVLIKYHFNTGCAVMDLIDVLKRLNHAIDDKNYEIGISFFLTPNLREDIENIWRMEIEPYLEEYFFNNLGKVDEFRWDNIKEYLTI